MGLKNYAAAVLAGAALVATLKATAAPPASAPPAPATVLADTRKALQVNYTDRDGAVSRKDVDGALGHYAPEFVGVGLAGKAHDLKEERADFVKTFTTLNPRTSDIKTTIDKLTLAKAKTEAAATVSRHGVLLIVDPQTKLNNVLVLDGTYQDTWAKRAGAWRLTREQTISLKATMNGQPL